jgi:hypothetical protein
MICKLADQLIRRVFFWSVHTLNHGFRLRIQLTIAGMVEFVFLGSLKMRYQIEMSVPEAGIDMLLIVPKNNCLFKHNAALRCASANQD